MDATDRLPPDPTGYTHNAAVGDIDGDGDIDILVANTLGDWITGAYFLMNDGKEGIRRGHKQTAGQDLRLGGSH